jgi:hypothetical protein
VTARLVDVGSRRVAARNPYWDQWGVTIVDPDEYRLVLLDRSLAMTHHAGLTQALGRGTAASVTPRRRMPPPRAP